MKPSHEITFSETYLQCQTTYLPKLHSITSRKLLASDELMHESWTTESPLRPWLVLQNTRITSSDVTQVYTTSPHKNTHGDPLHCRSYNLCQNGRASRLQTKKGGHLHRWLQGNPTFWKPCLWPELCKLPQNGPLKHKFPRGKTFLNFMGTVCDLVVCHRITNKFN